MKFSLKITLTGLILAALMLKASAWQYSKYLQKTSLLNGYSLNSSEKPLAFPTKFSVNNQIPESELNGILYRKVVIKGTYDFSSQVLISNKKDRTGPGFWIITPFKIDGSDISIMVSRGFIPFTDRQEHEWQKYNREPNEELIGIVKESVKQRFAVVPVKASALGDKVFLYPDIEQISEIFDFQTLGNVFIQRINKPGDPEFPKEAISLRVPPSTHYGYTFEWAFLALLTLGICTAIQVSPGLRNRFSKKMFYSKPQVTQDK